MTSRADRFNRDGSIRHRVRDIAGPREEAPIYVRPNDDDPLPEDPLPPRKYSKAAMRERLSVSGNNDD